MPNELPPESPEGFISEQKGQFLENPIRKSVAVARDAVITAYGVHLMLDVVVPHVEQAVNKISEMIVERYNNGE